MERQPSPTRLLRRIRRALAAVAGLTLILIVAACRLGATSRLLAAAGVVACLVAWVLLLDVEGRLADRLERRGNRRVAPGPRGRARPSMRSLDRPRRRCAA